MRQRFFIYLCLVITLLLWASSFIAIKVALIDYSPYALSVYRYIIASIVLLVIAVFIKVQFPQKRDLFRFFMIGFIGIAIYNVTLNYGEQTVSAGATSFIINTVPMITFILSIIFLKEKINTKRVMGMMISFTGIVIITFGEHVDVVFNKGVLFVVIAAFSQSIFFILQKPLLEKYSSFSLICWSIWLGTFTMLPFLIGNMNMLLKASFESNMSLLYLGVFPGAIGYLVWTYVLSKMKVQYATSFLYLIPVISVLIAIGWIREFPNGYIILGGAIVIVGVIIFNRKKKG
ncbi:DMT family transporter [Aquimarina aquimarini]|uniref:DMT family transporter n=1 Tax=Aquimarina aquimarini TaxID=1191734 RepID=UPI000D55B669|nr:DMT family transporter [Aquimarina aquimarini]